ncbi:MAG TPA: zinc ribbon domain-containing protein [Anaerolineales bacterium]|nr:zinc ribbon domain-containing protein [Anaerolineales bacterium]
MNRIRWTAVAIFSVIVLFVLLLGVSLLGGWSYGGWGRMGPGMMGPGMMGGWGFGPFGWIGMIFMWLIPVSFIVLVVLGIAWLVKMIGGAGGPTYSTRTCPNCGRAVQAAWSNCPYCGQALS